MPEFSFLSVLYIGLFIEQHHDGQSAHLKQHKWLNPTVPSLKLWMHLSSLSLTLMLL